MRKHNWHDSVEQHFARLKDGNVSDVDSAELAEKAENESEELDETRSSILLPGTRINKVEIIRQVKRPNKQGREVLGRDRECRCFAPSGPGGAECGRIFTVKYASLYGEIYSCGCMPRPKHPPYRLENRTIGCVKVGEWDTERAAWEIFCGICGKTFYRRTKKEAEASGESCEGHNVASADDAEALRPRKRKPGRPVTRLRDLTKLAKGATK